MAMNRRYVHLLAGVLLLAAGTFYLARIGRGWNPPWRQAAPGASHKVEPEPGDPALVPANAQVYGVLASAGEASAPDAAADTPTAPVKAAAIDHVAPASANASVNFLHKKFAVNKYHGFELIVPAHTYHPKVHGTFKSYAPGGGSAADMIVMLLNEQEFGDFVRGEAGTASFSTDPSAGGQLDWALNSPMFEAQKYYLIFRSASSGNRTRVVDANFTITSE
jgi:hypothetical protein